MGKKILALLCLIIMLGSGAGFSVQAITDEEIESENEMIEEYLVEKAEEFKRMIQTKGFKKFILGLGVCISCFASFDIGKQIKEIRDKNKKE